MESKGSTQTDFRNDCGFTAPEIKLNDPLNIIYAATSEPL